MLKTNIHLEKPRILFSEEQIQKRIKELAEEINRDYKDTDELIVIGVLKGAIIFLTDLIRHLDIPLKVEFVRLASYGNDTKSSGRIKPVDLTLPNLQDKDVLVIEDIVDTGLTATFFIDYLKYHHKTKTLKLASLLDKPVARTHPIKVDYLGFEVENKFVVGYGLDYAGFCRNIPYIGYYPHNDEE
ncbi:MAG: hypoxanthine phosphoribosyltransferase [Cyanobacteriota bacterium]